MKSQIEVLTSSVKTETVKNVDIALKDNVEKIEKATKRLTDYDTKIAARIESSLSDFKEKQKSFFEFDGIRSYLFWAGSVLNILIFIMLVYFLFFKA